MYIVCRMGLQGRLISKQWYAPPPPQLSAWYSRVSSTHSSVLHQSLLPEQPVEHVERHHTDYTVATQQCAIAVLLQLSTMAKA